MRDASLNFCKHQFWDSSKSDEKSIRFQQGYHSLMLLTLDKLAHERLVFLQTFTVMDRTSTIAAPILGRKFDDMDKSLN